MNESYGFIVAIADEPIEWIMRVILGWKQCHPGTPMIFVDDGSDRSDVFRIAPQYGAEYCKSSRLKDPMCGMEWWIRFFNLQLLQNADVVFKIDPDSILWRPFRQPFPDADVFGTFHQSERTWPDGSNGGFIHGGCQGIRRAAARKILADKRYLSHPSWRGSRRWEGFPIYPFPDWFSTDHSLSVVVKELALSEANWSEVFSDHPYNPSPQNANLDFAITHSHKTTSFIF